MPWEAVLASVPKDMWTHSGRCFCGRKTYLFGRCPKCIREEAQDALDVAKEGAEDLSLAEERPAGFALRSAVFADSAKVAGAAGSEGQQALEAAIENMKEQGTSAVHFVTLDVLQNLTEAIGEVLQPSPEVCAVDASWGCSAKYWRPESSFVLPRSREYKYRASWVVKRSGQVVQLQPCTEMSKEGNHIVSPKEWRGS